MEHEILDIENLHHLGRVFRVEDFERHWRLKGKRYVNFKS